MIPFLLSLCGSLGSVSAKPVWVWVTQDFCFRGSHSFLRCWLVDGGFQCLGLPLPPVLSIIVRFRCCSSLSGCLRPAWPLCLQNQGTEKELSRYFGKNRRSSQALQRIVRVEMGAILGSFQPRGDSGKQLFMQDSGLKLSPDLQPSSLCIVLEIGTFRRFYCGRMIQQEE